jgi:hypothetical protein
MVKRGEYTTDQVIGEVVRKQKMENGGERKEFTTEFAEGRRGLGKEKRAWTLESQSPRIAKSAKRGAPSRSLVWVA